MMDVVLQGIDLDFQLFSNSLLRERLQERIAGLAAIAA